MKKTIIEYCDDNDDILYKEQYWIDHYKNIYGNNLVNIISDFDRKRVRDIINEFDKKYNEPRALEYAKRKKEEQEFWDKVIADILKDI